MDQSIDTQAPEFIIRIITGDGETTDRMVTPKKTRLSHTVFVELKESVQPTRFMKYDVSELMRAQKLGTTSTADILKDLDMNAQMTAGRNANVRLTCVLFGIKEGEQVVAEDFEKLLAYVEELDILGLRKSDEKKS